MLTASPAARQALVHGLSLFQLAAVRLLHSAASGSQPRNLPATFDADAAKVAVQLTRSYLQQAADEVGVARSTCCRLQDPIRMSSKASGSMWDGRCLTTCILRQQRQHRCDSVTGLQVACAGTTALFAQLVHLKPLPAGHAWFPC